MTNLLMAIRYMRKYLSDLQSERQRIDKRIAELDKHMADMEAENQAIETVWGPVPFLEHAS